MVDIVHSMDDAAFRMAVDQALAGVPEHFAKKLENVAVLVEDEPSVEILRENGIEPGHGTLLGLYHGIPRTERGSEYGVGETLPDTITLYQKPILDAAQEEGKSVEEVVRETVWHEIAHYFGMGEDEVQRREDKSTNRY